MVHETSFPTGTTLYHKQFEYSFRDAFSVTTEKSNLDAIQVYYEVFSSLPKPVNLLMKLRNYLAVFLGLDASSAEMCGELKNIAVGQSAGFLTFKSVSTTEVISTAVEKNMQLWISVLKVSSQEFIVSTLVHLKTKRSQWYMKMIHPFHKWVARYTIQQAIRQNRL